MLVSLRLLKSSLLFDIYLKIVRRICLSFICLVYVTSYVLNIHIMPAKGYIVRKPVRALYKGKNPRHVRMSVDPEKI